MDTDHRHRLPAAFTELARAILIDASTTEILSASRLCNRALFLTRAHTRLLRTGLAEIHGPPVPTKLRAAARAYDNAINELARTSVLAA